MPKKTFARQLILVVFAFVTIFINAQTAEPPAVLTIQVDKPVSKVSPTLYGLMTEEINYSYDGGLYAEMVSNRTYNGDWSGVHHWFLVEDGDGQAKMGIDKETGPSESLPRSLRVDIEKASAGNAAGVLNDGFWGMPLRPNTTYKGSFYAKANSETLGPITVSLVENQSGKVIATTIVAGVSVAWKEYPFTLKTGEIRPSSANHLVLSVAQPGTLWLNLVSLFPPTYHDRINGNRIDLMEKLAAMHPAFLRFPGGNYLEGDHISERFEWKKTIGPLVDRPTHPSPWRYHSSDGMGLLEFLGWCEDLKMQPVLAVYAGYSLMHEYVKPGPDLEPYVQDALDEIEYVTGSTDTKWGAVRAKDGHPEPFHLTYVEIGNEDEFDKSGSYDDRYAQFYKAIKAKYPNLQLIATTPVKGIRPDVIDDHYYRRATEFFADTTHYDKTDRNGPKIFVGEWATREGTPTPNFGAALGDAAWMTGMERNSDVIVMAAYAPLLVNVNPGGMQWPSDLIGYDALNSYGSPSYHAQVMFSTHLGDQILASKLETTNPRLFESVTYDSKTHRMHLKLVNASSIPQTVQVKLNGATHVAGKVTLTTLSGRTTQETNSITDPTRVVPVVSSVAIPGAVFTHTVPRYAIQVFNIDVN